VRDEELTAAIQEVRDRVRSRHAGGGSTVPDWMPLIHARDLAEAKVAAIGSVNPRRSGLGNWLIQWAKRGIARALDWHVREQVEFNRAVLACVQATLEALKETHRAMASEDFRARWEEWRKGFESRHSTEEIHILRTISELQAAFEHRVTQQHGEFTAALDHNTTEVQQRLWKDLQQVRAEYQALIHRELTVIRQRLLAQTAPSASPAQVAAEPAPVSIDWLRFAEQFRGSEERVREHQRRYLPRFAGAAEVLDLGCGRGEFLEAARDAGLAARGVDHSRECVALCRAKGLDAAQADLFPYLSSLPDDSLGGAFCAHVVEHLPPGRLPSLVHLLARKLRAGALAAIETPNPECLEIFATHFYIDPTHTRPVPPVLLRFYLEEAGFGNIEIERLSPLSDYAIVARKL
jgi:SAM-dependent methyltransferase